MAKKKDNRGRKPVKDKMVQLSVCVRQSVIDRLGGKEICKELLLMEVEKW